MKSALFAKALTLTAALAIAFTPGCRRKAKEPITPIPGRTGDAAARIPNPPPGIGGGSDTSRALTPGGSLGDGSDVTGSGVTQRNISPNENIGLGAGPIDPSMFDADRSQFAANVVYFDFDSAILKSSEKGKLGAVSSYLKGTANVALQIEGHCDERGTEEYNRSLGERRALAIREELALEGVDPNRVVTISYGEDRPAVSGSNESAWSKNRRGEFILLRPK
jgi:peptidoglycan-associated lipoprotein